MLNFSLYKKKIGINKELQDYIKKTNTHTFNQIMERNKLLSKPLILNYNNIKNDFLNNIYTLDNNVYNLDNLDNLSQFSDLTKIDNLYDSSTKTNNVELLIRIFITGTKFIGFAYLIIKKILYPK